jgi:uncharacterized membrane protein YhiD involved in acid resistance
MIILDIPQGAITVASAILVAAAAGFVTFGVFVLRLLLSIQDRVKAVETMLTPNDAQEMKSTNARMEIVWDWYKQWARNLRAMQAPENPMKQERWNELADKLHLEQLSDEEAEELLSALLRREEQAVEERDLAALAILGPGIILTRWQLKEKELREQK